MAESPIGTKQVGGGNRTAVPNIDIHDLADRNRSHSHQMLRGAFRITPQSLRALQAIFDQAAGGGGKSIWIAFLANEEPKALETLDEVLNIRNPQGNPIWGLYLKHVGPDIANRLFITSAASRQSAAIHFSTDGNSTDKVSSLVGRVRDESRNIRLWYWPARWISDHLMFLAWQHGKVIATTVVVACLSALLIGALGQAIVAASKPAKGPEETHEASSSPDEKRPEMTEAQKDALEAQVRRLREEAEKEAEARSERIRKETLAEFWRMLMWGGGLGAAAFLFLLSWTLFPRAVFEIGEGKERYQRLCTIRTYLIGTVMLSGFLIPWVRTYVMPSTPPAQSQPSK